MRELNSWLLINYSPFTFGMKLFPLGIAYISSTLKQTNNFSVHCLDLAFIKQEQHEQAIFDALRTSGAGVVGINGFSNEFAAIRTIVASIRSYNKDIVIVAGGHMVSSDPERTHSLLSLDYSVVGEGEETIIELANAIASRSDCSTIPGIVYNNGGLSLKTSERKSKKDIDELPFPDYSGFNLARYLDNQRDFPDTFSSYTDNPRSAPILLARSCPYKCTFCSHSIKQYRKRKLDAVFKEIDHLVSTFGVTGIGIYDDLFATDSQMLDDFCSRIAPTGLKWGCQVRADIADRALLERLRSSGCTCISYGFESLHEDVLKSMKKQISPRNIKTAAKLTYESKLLLQANFIFGDTAETIESIDRTMSWWVANMAYGINLTTIQVFPGTALYNDFVQRGIITNEVDYIEKGFHYLNGTQVPFADYLLFVHGIRGAFALMISCYVSHIEVHNDDCNRVTVNVICPHCGVALEYGNVKIGPALVICKECYSKFRIPVVRALGRTHSTAEQTTNISVAIDLIHQGKYNESMERAESGDMSDVDAINTLATTCLYLGDIGRAKELFLRVLAIEPANALAHNNYGICLGYFGLLGWSLLHFRQAVFIDDCQVAQANANIASDWLSKNFDAIPFVQKTEGFPSHTLSIGIPVLSDSTPCIKRVPLRESLTCHPLAGALF